MIKALDIAGVRCRTNLILSPMSGVTDCAFRTLVRDCSGESVGLVVSEFVAAEGLTRRNPRTLSMLRFTPGERPIAIQIFGAEPDRMADAARVVEQAGADIVDVNCGCPAPKVVRRGGGAELMREPGRLGRILAAVKKAVSIPMTVKIRSGWDGSSINAVEVARLAEQEGADLVAVHGRTRMQLYSGRADWELVGRVADSLVVPVVGSGDVVEPQQALERLSSSGAAGVMIGRSTLDNPWIIRQIADLAAGRPATEPSPEDRVAALRRFRDLLRETLPDISFLGRYRGMACRLVKGMRGASSVRRTLGLCRDVVEVDAVFSDFLLLGSGTTCDRGKAA
ncbi:MAG: tRNA dihydrouridine synthase DusB [Candidatus Binatia bacterium]